MVDCLSGAIAELGSTTSTGTPIVVSGDENQVSTWMEDDLTDELYTQGYFTRFDKQKGG